MSKIKGLLLSIILLPLTYADASQSTQQQMGPICQRGATAFYGQMTRTFSEQRLCKISDTHWEFWTKDSLHTAIGAKPRKVTLFYKEGVRGYTEGYDIYLTEKDIIGLRVVYDKENDSSPLAGFIIIGDEYIDLEPMTIITDQKD